MKVLGGVVQLVKYLPSKCEALSSTHITAKNLFCMLLRW
jgi:hypothetical protein